MSRVYAFVSPETGEIKQTINVGRIADPYVVGQTYEGLVLHDISDQENLGTFITDKYYDDGWHDKPEKPGVGYDFSADHTWVFNTARFEKSVRDKRDSLLAETDWTQVSDAPLSEVEVSAYATYRQALRDVPNNLDGTERSLDDITWPTKP